MTNVVRFSISCMVIVCVLAIATASATTYSKSELIEKSSLCIQCHDDKGTSLESSVHRLSGEKDVASRIGIGCLSCHDNGEKHAEDPGSTAMQRLVVLPTEDQSALCSRCHLTPHQVSMASTDPHGKAGMACLDCHSVHADPSINLPKAGENRCAECHSSVAAEFRRRSAHPLEEGNVRCIDCHNLGETEPQMLAAGLDWRCQGCHAEQAGPFSFEHPVTSNHLVEGGGCIECHNPHGSPNERLLAQPGIGVCLQCHGIPPLHRTQHEGLAMSFGCVDCHSDIHGSYSNGKFIDPQLGSKMSFDCSVCHDLGR